MPVQYKAHSPAVRHGNRLQRTAAVASRRPDFHPLQIANVAIQNQFHAALQNLLAPLLGAVLENPLVFAASLKHGSILVQSVAQGLLQVDVLAGAHRRQTNGHMPVIRRRHHHRIHARVASNSRKVVIELRLQTLLVLYDFAGVFPALAKRVANGHRGGAADPDEIIQQISALAAHADVAELDSLAGRVFARQDPQGNEVRGHGGNQRAAQHSADKATAGQLMVLFHISW